MSLTEPARFQIKGTALEPDALKEALSAESAGACVSFEGWVRDNNDGQPVVRLEYETQLAIAGTEGKRVLHEALARFDIIAAHCVHRVGPLQIGDCAVWVGVSAAHRGAAFDACRYIIDEIKQRLPIWKKEHYASGESGWVNCARARADEKPTEAATS